MMLYCIAFGDGSLFSLQKTGNAIRALGRITSLQKLMKTSSSGDGNASASVSSASGVGSSSSSSGLSSMGSQSTITDAKYSSHTKNSSNSLKGNTVELEKVGTPGTPKLTNQDKDVFTSNTQNGGTNTKVNHHEKRDINSNTKDSINSAMKNRTSEYSPKGAARHSTDRETCKDCTDNLLVRHVSHQSSNSGCPEFTKAMVKSTAFLGDVVRFDVEYKADENISVTWYFEDDVITGDSRYSIQKSKGGSSLLIRNVCEDDDGEYSCKISNMKGEDTCSAELIVYGNL